MKLGPTESKNISYTSNLEWNRFAQRLRAIVAAALVILAMCAIQLVMGFWGAFQQGPKGEVGPEGPRGEQGPPGPPSRTSTIVGTIVAFSGSTQPDGWMFCDGRPLKVNEYPELFAVIRNAWGDSLEGSFLLPDLRGTLLFGANESGSVGKSQIAVRGSLGPAAFVDLNRVRIPFNNTFADTLVYSAPPAAFPEPVSMPVRFANPEAEIVPQRVAVNWIIKY